MFSQEVSLLGLLNFFPIVHYPAILQISSLRGRIKLIEKVALLKGPRN